MLSIILIFCFILIKGKKRVFTIIIIKDEYRTIESRRCFFWVVIVILLELKDVFIDSIAKNASMCAFQQAKKKALKKKRLLNRSHRRRCKAAIVSSGI